MKLLFTVLGLFLTGGLLAQTFCLRLTEVSNDGSDYVVMIEMQGSAEFDLGSSNLQWSFNENGLADPVLFSSPLAPPFYQIPTVTNQGAGEVSFNIELGFVGFGSTIGNDPNWTLLGLVSFTITDPANVLGMEWSYNGGTTQTVVFIDDEATQIFATDPSCLEGVNAPLAVDFLSFDAHKKEDFVLLDWRTANETNNKGFEVQKSADAANWNPIAWVDGKGTTLQEQNYQIKDTEPSKGSNYYRLKQVDENGDFEFSSIRHVAYNTGNAIQISPNPAHEEVFIQHPDEVQMTEILVYDQVGHLVFRKIPNGNVLDVSTLAAGVYFIEIYTDDQRHYHEKLLIQKK